MAFLYNSIASSSFPCQAATQPDGCQTLKYAATSSSTLPQAQVRCQKLKYGGAYLKKMTAYLQMTAYLRVPHLFEIDHGFETPIALPLTARHHGGFSQDQAWSW